MSEEFEESSQQKISRFNGTVAQLMRLDILWKDCHRHSRDKFYDKWNDDLDRVWCELSEDAAKEEDEKFWEFANSLVVAKKEHRNQYNILLRKEMFLRKLQNKQGKGTAYEDPESDW